MSLQSLFRPTHLNTTISRKKPFDLTLSLITKRTGIKEQSPFIEKVLRAVKGGVSTVILDDTHRDQKACLSSARLLKAMLPDKVQLVVKNHFFIADVVKTGLLLEKSQVTFQDMEPFYKRRALGVTVKDKKEIFLAEQCAVDYVAVPLEIWGIEGLKWVRCLSSHPILATGPIKMNKLEEVCEQLDLEQDGVAVTEALWDAQDLTAAAREMLAVINQVKYSQSLKV